jgi:hypothetical protein
LTEWMDEVPDTSPADYGRLDLKDFAPLFRQYGLSAAQAVEAFKNLEVAYAAVYSPETKEAVLFSVEEVLAKHCNKNRNHGPRPNVTFDKKGLRRF